MAAFIHYNNKLCYINEPEVIYINPNKIFFIALVTAMLSCSSTDAVKVESKPQVRNIITAVLPELNQIEDITETKRIGSGIDTSLSLYRNSTTHSMVVDFFSEAAPSDRISMPIIYYADKYDIPFSLAFSLSWVESRFSPKAVNKNYSSIDRGLFQLNNRSFPELSERDFFNPEINTRNGLKYLRYCIDAGGSEIMGLAMYNAGRRRVTTRGAPYSTLVYIGRIIEYRNSLELEFRKYIAEQLEAKMAENQEH